MNKVILICGKICAGKTRYAQELMKGETAVLLSSDELISALYHPHENDHHDAIIGRVHAYLLDKAVQILRTGTNVILDWGFWSAAQRADINAFFKKHGIRTEWHYLDIDDTTWYTHISARNRAVLAGELTDFFVDEGLLKKVKQSFEVPDRTEMNVWCRKTE